MAARRLLIILLILLVISSLAAILAPPRPEDNETTETGVTNTSTAPAPAAQPGSSGKLLRATIDADDPQTAVVPLTAGDELELEVRSKRPDQVEIPALGLVEVVSRDTPASFDLLLENSGNYEVRLVESGRLAGRLEVSPAARRE